MPVTPTYPGVYIEEIPSGVRTITGVATSITAFIGRAKRGPRNEAKTINSFADYERIFGGLDLNSTMSFAVRDCYLNGGSQAIIVRLYHDVPEEARIAAQDVADAATGADANAAAQNARTEADTFTDEPKKAAADKVAKAAEAAATQPNADSDSVQKAAQAAVPPPAKTKFTVDGVKLEAAYEGSWGAYLRAEVDTENVSTPLFNLTVRDVSPGGDTEKYLSLSFEKDSSRRVDKVLAARSKLVRWDGDYPEDSPPTPSPQKDAVTLAEEALKTKNEEEPGEDTSQEEAALTTAREALAASDGVNLDVNDFTGPGLEAQKKGLFALEQVDLFNLLCLPPYLVSGDVDKSLIAKATSYCEKRRAMLLVDSPSSWTDKDTAKAGINSGVGAVSKNAALYFPRLRLRNPLRENRIEEFVPCGAVAGIMARTDTQRGVWKAPAGIEATLRGAPELSVKLTDPENGELNPLGVNCLRSFPIIGRIVWGSRTLRGADILADEYKYVPVRRLALFIEESLFRGTQWVVFEPNDEPLWAQIRLNVGAFMNNLFRQGAFQGTSSREAYFVKCDKETTPQNDIDRGIVNIVVGFAPLKPAEFVIIKLQQIAGDIEV